MSELDPQTIYINALDNAFDKWVEESLNNNKISYAEYCDLVERWDRAKPEPIVYTGNDIEEGWGGDYEMFLEDATPAMEKDMETEIQKKSELLKEIQEDYDS